MGKKALQYLELCIYINMIIFFATIVDLFNHLKNIFNNPYWKKHAIKKFHELKIGANFFINFYSKFIYFALDLKYILEILI